MFTNGRRLYLTWTIALTACLYTLPLAAIKHIPPEPSLLFNKGISAYQCENWYKASRLFGAVVCLSDSHDALSKEAALYQGIADYHLGEFERAHTAFSIYLTQRQNAPYFFAAIEYEFAIAEALRSGAKAHLWSIPCLPRCGPGDHVALEIYDEIALAVPSHNLAARSLYAKASLLARQHAFSEAVAALQTLLRRFPKHALAPQAYHRILEIYVLQATYERQNPDVLPLAQIALQKFKQHFPRDEQMCAAEYAIAQIEELYADSLYAMGRFYERIEAPCAAVVCYTSAERQFPTAPTTNRCRQRLAALTVYTPPVLATPSVDDGAVKPLVTGGSFG